MRIPFVDVSAGDELGLVQPTQADETLWHSLSHAPWAADYPYRPQVRVLLGHTEDALRVAFQVSEEQVRAASPADNGRVWEDSCCEFFCQFDDAGYYNIECNAAGTVLMGWGATRDGRELASAEVLSGIARWSSLGRQPFEAQPAPACWRLSLVIPAEAFWHHRIPSFRGLSFRANVYKCGDLLDKPHFLSLFPIAVEKPDFHRPDFFQPFVCE